MIVVGLFCGLAAGAVLVSAWQEHDERLLVLGLLLGAARIFIALYAKDGA